LEENINELIDKIKALEREKEEKQGTIDNLQNQLNQIQNEHDALPTLPTLNDYQLLQTTITQSQNRLGINDLNSLPALPQGETLTSLLARPTPTQLNDLRREKDQELTAKNTQITDLINQVNNANNRENNLQTQLTTTKRELDKEKD
jgi:predicted RNase H-like nuclease (RuvC/YqgF family)